VLSVVSTRISAKAKTIRAPINRGIAKACSPQPRAECVWVNHDHCVADVDQSEAETRGTVNADEHSAMTQDTPGFRK
jgi:hypothetical protein